MKIIVVAGGTGGHVYPALSVAREFKENSAEVIWIGRKKSLRRVLPEKKALTL